MSCCERGRIGRNIQFVLQSAVTTLCILLYSLLATYTIQVIAHSRTRCLVSRVAESSGLKGNAPGSARLFLTASKVQSFFLIPREAPVTCSTLHFRRASATEVMHRPRLRPPSFTGWSGVWVRSIRTAKPRGCGARYCRFYRRAAYKVR